MKLVRFGAPGNERPGIWLENEPDHNGPVILDVKGMAFDIDDYNEHFFRTSGIARVSHLLRESSRKLIAAEGVRLGAPITRPGKIICMGGNYSEHIRESGGLMPEEPVFFSKASSSVIGPFDPICLPAGSSVVDGEVELAVVICREAKNVRRESAMDYVAGVTILNDVSDREAQKSGRQWFRAKSADTFCPLGPYLVTREELSCYDNLRLYSKLNGDLLQEGNTSDMLVKIPDVIALLSKTITLLPGDVISTGTPSGIGSVRTPPLVLQKGDTLETGVEQLGRQSAEIV